MEETELSSTDLDVSHIHNLLKKYSIEFSSGFNLHGWNDERIINSHCLNFYMTILPSKRFDLLINYSKSEEYWKEIGGFEEEFDSEKSIKLIESYIKFM